MTRGLAAPQADAIAEEVYDDDDDGGGDDDDDGSVDSDPYDLSALPQVLRWIATRCNAMQPSPQRCNASWVATRCNGMQRQLGCNALQRDATPVVRSVRRFGAGVAARHVTRCVAVC